MATGCMATKISGKLKHHCTLLGILSLFVAVEGVAQEVGLAGVMGNKALLMINGGDPQTVPVGQALDGVKVLSIQGDQVMIEVGGRKRPLRVGQHAIGVGGGDGSGKIMMTADAQGHFFTTGTINGTSVRFLVDTGATMISLGVKTALHKLTNDKDQEVRDWAKLSMEILHDKPTKKRRRPKPQSSSRE